MAHDLSSGKEHASGNPVAEGLCDHAAALRVKAQMLTRNRPDADDLVQDTFELALRKAHLFQPGTNLRAWLSRMMFNLYVTHYRRARRRPDGASLDAVAEAATQAACEPAADVQGLSPAELLADETFMAALPAALREGLTGLDPRFRDVLLLSTIGERSYQDIAEQLAIPLGTVMSRASRARAHLRAQVAGKGLVSANLSVPLSQAG